MGEANGLKIRVSEKPHVIAAGGTDDGLVYRFDHKDYRRS